MDILVGWWRTLTSSVEAISISWNRCFSFSPIGSGILDMLPFVVVRRELLRDVECERDRVLASECGLTRERAAPCAAISDGGGIEPVFGEEGTGGRAVSSCIGDSSSCACGSSYMTISSIASSSELPASESLISSSEPNEDES